MKTGKVDGQSVVLTIRYEYVGVLFNEAFLCIDLHVNAHSRFPTTLPLDRSGRGRGGQLPDADAQARGPAAPPVRLLRHPEAAGVGPLPQVQHLGEQLHQDRLRNLS